MAQLIITEGDFIDGSTLRGPLPEEIALSPTQYKVGLCWISLASELRSGGASKIYVTSDSVQGKQHFNQKALIGSFQNVNNKRHFFSESSSPQIFGTLKNVNSINLSLYNEDGNLLSAAGINHLSICIVLLEAAEMSHTILSLTGEMTDYGSNEEHLHYMCRVGIPEGITFSKDSKIALTEIFLPELIEYRRGRTRKVKADQSGGIFHVTLECGSISFDASLGSRILRSFCVKTGQRHYTAPYTLFTRLSPGSYNTLEFTLKFKSCAELMRLKFQGQVEIAVAITE